MAILDNRVKIKSNLVELGKFITFSLKKFFILILLLTSYYFLYFSPPKVLSNGVSEIAGDFLSIGNFFYTKITGSSQWVRSRLSYFQDLETENLELKRQLIELKKKEQASSDAKLENIEFRKILQVIPDIKYNFVTAKVIGISITPFSSSATIQAGEKHNVKLDDIVRSKDGLIGKISSVSPNYSTVMLINDHNSRIPVITEDSKVKGILSKQGEHLTMMYLKENHTAKSGEIIHTSGDGKIYPKGIEVGKIEKITNEGAFVKTLENFNDIDFVIIESRQE